MRSLYVTLFGGSFQTAQRTDMRKRRRARVFFLHFKTSHFFCDGSFRTAQRTGMRGKKRGGTCTPHMSLFLAGLLELHNVLI